LGPFQSGQIFPPSAGKIVQNRDRIAVLEQVCGQMRADEAGPAGYYGSDFILSRVISFPETTSKRKIYSSYEI